MNCVEGGLINPKCYTFEAINFKSEEQIFDILLDVFKSELPKRLAQVKDCQNKPMIIEESSIGILYPDQVTRFAVVLNPLGDIPSYDDSMQYRDVEYKFDLILTVGNEIADCVTWELLRFKNVVEGLLIGSQLVIDGYQSVDIEPGGFNYLIPTKSNDGVYYRQGSYRFSVTVSQFKEQN